MRVAYLEKRDPARNMQRYYRVSVAPTLFGEFAVVREWGRIGQRGGSRRECWFSSEEEAVRSGQAMAEAKRRRGYAVNRHGSRSTGIDQGVTVDNR